MHNIVAWNGASYTALSSGMNGPIASLTIFNGILYAGGSFSQASGLSANNTAWWGGNSWVPLGSGVNGPVATMYEFNNLLYVGGNFSGAGSVAAENFAYWTGNQWGAPTTGVNGPIEAIAVYNGALFVGGLFSTAGSVASTFAALWTGSSWSNTPGAFLTVPVDSIYSGCDVNQVAPSCLTPGAIAGIVIGCVFGAGLIVLIISGIVHNRQGRKGTYRGHRGQTNVVVQNDDGVIMTAQPATTVVYPTTTVAYPVTQTTVVYTA